MISIKFLQKNETEEIFSKLKEQFGIKEIPGKIVKIGSERIFLFNGNIPEKTFNEIEKTTIIERAGIYIGKIFLPTGEIRLSIEGTYIFKKHITKNIFEIPSEEEAKKWMSGEELNIKTGLKGMIVMKYKDDFLGCGKASENKIGNFIPKNRRLKSKSIIE